MDKIMIHGMARRSDKRLEDPPIISVVKTKDQSHNAEIINISRKGLRFRSEEKCQKGDKLVFDFNTGDVNLYLSLSIRGKVVNDYGSKDDGLHEYGVKFNSLLQWYEMNCIHNFVYAVIKR